MVTSRMRYGGMTDWPDYVRSQFNPVHSDEIFTIRPLTGMRFQVIRQHNVGSLLMKISLCLFEIDAIYLTHLPASEAG